MRWSRADGALFGPSSVFATQSKVWLKLPRLPSWPQSCSPSLCNVCCAWKKPIARWFSDRSNWSSNDCVRLWCEANSSSQASDSSAHPPSLISLCQTRRAACLMCLGGGVGWQNGRWQALVGEEGGSYLLWGRALKSPLFYLPSTSGSICHLSP